MKNKRGQTRPPDHQQGIWSWNDASFQLKYTAAPDDSCWLWQGSAGPHGALFGAYKNSHPQMTQARRIAWMRHNQRPCEDIAVRMICHNSMCVNPHHMVTAPNYRNPLRKLHD